MKLNFANIDNAFKMGSSNFKDTQEEIANLKKLIQSDKPKKKTQMDDSPYSITPKINEPMNNFNQPMNNFNQPMNQQFNSFDYNLLKVMGDPRFDHVVRNYVLINHPEWLNCSNQQQNQSQNVPQKIPSLSKSTFGNNYSSNICYEIKRYIVFFIFSVVIFLFLSLI